MTFDFETNSRWEPYLNYSFGFFTIVTVLLSTILNPLILHLRQKEKKSTNNQVNQENTSSIEVKDKSDFIFLFDCS